VFFINDIELTVIIFERLVKVITNLAVHVQRQRVHFSSLSAICESVK
jgi:hypothetical protein